MSLRSFSLKQKVSMIKIFKKGHKITQKYCKWSPKCFQFRALCESGPCWGL